MLILSLRDLSRSVCRQKEGGLPPCGHAWRRIRWHSPCFRGTRRNRRRRACFCPDACCAFGDTACEYGFCLTCYCFFLLHKVKCFGQTAELPDVGSAYLRRSRPVTVAWQGWCCGQGVWVCAQVCKICGEIE